MVDDFGDSKNLVSVLQRALFYESQYRNAILSDSISFYDANLTKDIIENDVLYKDDEGNFNSSLELLGLSAPCKFSEFIEKWIDNKISPNWRDNNPTMSDPRKVLLESFQEGKRDYVVEYWAELGSNRRKFLSQRFLLTQNEFGEICALSIVKDKTSVQTLVEDKQKKTLEKYAYYDPVTHGYNYIKFKNKLREINSPGVIISLDIHSFKVINTVCGILKGDSVIEAIWSGIVDVLDFEENDLAGHINADHFIIYIPTFDEEKIIRKLKNITLAFSFISTELSVPQIKPYFGVAKWTPEKTIELAYSESVTAKYNAKEMQSQNYSFFDEKDTIRLFQEKQILDDFEEALAKKEFKIWYQPKYNPVNRKLVGAEALVRWMKSDGTVISPGMFIPILEKNGMIRQFDEYIFRNVCQQQNLWQLQQKEIVPVSINLSRISLYYRSVVHQYERIAIEEGVDKSYLPIEITETAAITNNEIKEIADEFYKSGFSLHMDDFGSGYSSLATLNIMHFDTLKLDKSLIDYIGNFGGERLLEHTILLAKELGMHVTAEGVESENQVSFLKHIGCDSIQGYFYSKPLPPEKFELLLDTNVQSLGLYEYDFLSEHITKFKNSVIKPPLYTFVINLTQNSFYEPTNEDWKKETQIQEKIYEKAVLKLANDFIVDEDRQRYLDFMNREKNINEYDGNPKTRLLQYHRKCNGEIVEMRVMNHLFKVSDSDDLWMYMTVTKL